MGPQTTADVLPYIICAPSNELVIPDPELLATVSIVGTPLYGLLTKYDPYAYPAQPFTRRHATLRELAAASVAQRAYNIHHLDKDTARTWVSEMCTLPNKALELVYKYGMMLQIITYVNDRDVRGCPSTIFARLRPGRVWGGLMLPPLIHRLVSDLISNKPSASIASHMVAHVATHLDASTDVAQRKYMVVIRDFMMHVEYITRHASSEYRWSFDIAPYRILLGSVLESPPHISNPVLDRYLQSVCVYIKAYWEFAYR